MQHVKALIPTNGTQQIIILTIIIILKDGKTKQNSKQTTKITGT